MRGLALSLLLLFPAAARAQAILEADRRGLLRSIDQWEAYLKLSGGPAAQLPELAGFRGRAKRSRSHAELRPVGDEFEQWKKGGQQAAAPFSFFGPKASPHSAQLGQNQPLDFWSGRLSGLAAKGDHNRFYDGNGRTEGVSVWTFAGLTAGPQVRRPFKADLRKISDLASAPPPKMVDKEAMGSYQKVVSYLMEVSQRSGLYQKLTALGVDPLPFMLSLVKSESDFRQRAVSSAGAYGYMQVLVPTAKGALAGNRSFYEEMTGKKLNTKEVTGQRLLDDWKMNVIAGTLFLKAQVEQFDGLVRGLEPARQGKMLINLICGAYNAGGGGLTKFLLDKQRVTWKDVENVENNEQARAKVAKAAATPEKSIVGYKETRGYVAKIQSWYDYWRSAWASWADDRMPASAPA